MTTESSAFVVVDASIAVKWLIEEENSNLAEELRRSWQDAGIRLVAPQLMPFEVGNAIYRRVTSGSLNFEDAAELMRDLMSQGIELYGGSAFYRDALQLATRLNQRAVYDSHYLALAQALDCDFWTADERFYRAANPDLANIRLISEAATPNQ